MLEHLGLILEIDFLQFYGELIDCLFVCISDCRVVDEVLALLNSKLLGDRGSLVGHLSHLELFEEEQVFCDGAAQVSTAYDSRQIVEHFQDLDSELYLKDFEGAKLFSVESLLLLF